MRIDFFSFFFCGTNGRIDLVKFDTCSPIFFCNIEKKYSSICGCVRVYFSCHKVYIKITNIRITYHSTSNNYIICVKMLKLSKNIFLKVTKFCEMR
jgi:hypothetical protein